MIHHDFNIRDINYWNIKTIEKNSRVYDIIFINYGKDKIDIPIYFLRDKNFCFNELLNDYIFLHSMNIAYIKELQILKNRIPYLYFESDKFFILSHNK